MTERRVLGDEALAELPVFPLPQVVLFPRVVMPLHIFEPRYRKMLADALDGHRAIAMALIPDPNDLDEHGRPKIAPIAGVGMIIEQQELPDGRSNILLHGQARVRLEELPFVPPYRRAKGTVLHEIASPVDASSRRAARRRERVRRRRGEARAALRLLGAARHAAGNGRRHLRAPPDHRRERPSGAALGARCRRARPPRHAGARAAARGALARAWRRRELKLVGRVPKRRVEEEGLVRLAYPPYDVLVSIIDGRACAIEDACNHAGASLAEGERDGACIVCPMHSYVFDLGTGKLVAPRGLCDDQRAFVAEIEGDEIAVYDPVSIVIR
jgi:Lon protease-like protein/nitrite reductase/ring-hydroxylating ferredoxin subunit